MALLLAEQCVSLSSKEQSLRKREFIEQGFVILESLWNATLFQRRDYSHDLGLSLLKNYLALPAEEEIKDSTPFFRKARSFLETLLQDKEITPENRDLALGYRAYIDFHLESFEKIEEPEIRNAPGKGKLI